MTHNYEYPESSVGCLLSYTRLHNIVFDDNSVMVIRRPEFSHIFMTAVACEAVAV